MSRMLFVNLPVADVAAPRSFFTGLGFDVDETFSDETTISVVINELTTVMMPQTERFTSFLADGAIVDTAGSRLHVRPQLPRPRRSRLGGRVDGPVADAGRVTRQA